MKLARQYQGFWRRFIACSFIVSLTLGVAGKVWAEETLIYSQLTDGYWQLWQMQSDGSNPKQLTTTNSDKREGECIDNGQRILYRTNNGQMKILDLKTKKDHEILAQYNRMSNPDYCDITQEILFIRYDPKGLDISDVWVAGPEGIDPRVITRDHRLKYQPAYSKNCQRITFVQADPEDSKSHQVWIMDADGSNQKQLTDDRALASGPRFYKEDSIVFASNKEKNYEIYRLHLKDNSVMKLTDHERLDTAPNISSMTGNIAFVSNRKGMQQVWVMDGEGLNQRVLSGDSAEAVDPAWCEISVKGMEEN